MLRNLAFSGLVACGLSAPAMAQGEPDAPAAARMALTTVCLDAIEYGHPVAVILDASARVAGQYQALGALPERVRPRTDTWQAWAVASSQGVVTLMDVVDPGRDCTVDVRGADTAAVEAELELWFLTPPAPFREAETPSGFPGRRWVWARDDFNIEMIVTAGADVLVASIYTAQAE